LIKLDAWLNRFCVGLEANASAAYRMASHAFNTVTSDGAQSAPFEMLAQNLDALAAHAMRWRDSMLQQSDLATRLLAFAGRHKANNLG
jgi:hypothetical protein